MQAGEERFAKRIMSHLGSDYLCWYELPVGIGTRSRYSDFIVLHPESGLLLLEVKDWKLDTIKKIDKVTATIITPRGVKTTSNPMEQVRQCTYQLIQQLETDPQLVQQTGRHQGKMVFPFSYGVVLSNITRSQFQSINLGEVLPEHQVICKDEMLKSVESMAFQEHLKNMFNVWFPHRLTQQQIDRIRWHLFPEIRINQGNLFPKENTKELSYDIVEVMDMVQERLARSLGGGHRVIHGVAGSGKTLILVYRCLYLAKLTKKPITVICYNITLAARLREMIAEVGISNKVKVHHFHGWCSEQLRTYSIDRPQSGNRYFDRLVETVLDAVDKGTLPKGQYGAVLIDEAHDFEPEWLKILVSMVDNETNSLLVLYDSAQSIYEKKTLDFSLSSVGVNAKGRTTILKTNYRNTNEVFDFAYQFFHRYLNPDAKDEDHVPVIEPNAAGRCGPQPEVKTFNSYEEEAGYIADIFKKMHDEHEIPLSDMCVIYRSNWMGEKLHSKLTSIGVPCQWLGDSQAKKQFKSSADSVKLMTMHSSKGLEFPMVAVSGVGNMPADGEETVSAAKLLYVAMTRSTKKLLLTGHKETEFLSRLEEFTN